MKTLFCKTGLLASFLSFLLNCNASPQEELLNLSRIDLLPQFRSDEKIRQITSFPMQYSEKEKLAQAVAINCPVSDFFGYAFGRPSMQSMIAGVKDRVHYCFFLHRIFLEKI